MTYTTEMRRYIMTFAHWVTKVTINTVNSPSKSCKTGKLGTWIRNDCIKADYRTTYGQSLKEMYKLYSKLAAEKAQFCEKMGYDADKTANYIAQRTARAVVEKFAENFEKIELDRKLGLKEIHYSEYKNRYSDCETIKNSYNPEAKTIKVFTNRAAMVEYYAHC